jgi:hypothetical protein
LSSKTSLFLLGRLNLKYPVSTAFAHTFCLLFHLFFIVRRIVHKGTSVQVTLISSSPPYPLPSCMEMAINLTNHCFSASSSCHLPALKSGSSTRKHKTHFHLSSLGVMQTTEQLWRDSPQRALAGSRPS